MEQKSEARSEQFENEGFHKMPIDEWDDDDDAEDYKSTFYNLLNPEPIDPFSDSPDNKLEEKKTTQKILEEFRKTFEHVIENRNTMRNKLPTCGRVSRILDGIFILRTEHDLKPDEQNVYEFVAFLKAFKKIYYKEAAIVFYPNSQEHRMIYSKGAHKVLLLRMMSVMLIMLKDEQDSNENREKYAEMVILMLKCSLVIN